MISLLVYANVHARFSSLLSSFLRKCTSRVSLSLSGVTTQQEFKVQSNLFSSYLFPFLFYYCLLVFLRRCKCKCIYFVENLKHRYFYLKIGHICCIFRPAFGCCACQTLVKIVIFSIFCAKNIKSKKFAANFSKKTVFLLLRWKKTEKTKFNQLLIFIEKFSPCRNLNPGPPQYQANMLPTELSWLGSLTVFQYIAN